MVKDKDLKYKNLDFIRKKLEENKNNIIIVTENIMIQF